MALEIPIDGTLDLHTFQPREIGDLLPDYLEACRARGILEVRIVHGKGSGALRRSVHAVLARSPLVRSFATAPPERGGWGATLVELIATGHSVRATVDPAAAAGKARVVPPLPAPQSRALVAVTAATVLVAAAMLIVDLPLRTDASPNGIVSYEMVWNRAGAERVLVSWDARARTYAAFGLGLDYLFLVLYSVTLMLACRAAASRVAPVWPALGSAGSRFAMAMPAAGICDGVENLGLFLLLLGASGEGWARIATGFAVVKFTLLLAGVGYIVTALLVARRRAF